MFSRRSKILALRLALADMALTALAFALAYYLRQHLSRHLLVFYLERPMIVGLLLSCIAIWSAVGLGLGVYRRPELFDAGRTVRDALVQAFYAGLILLGWLYVLKQPDVSRLFIALFTGINTVLLLAHRLTAPSMRRLAGRNARDLFHYVIVGTGPDALEIARLIEANEELGARLFAFVRERPAAPSAAATAPRPAIETATRSYPLRDLAELPMMLAEHVVDEIVFAVSKQQLDQMEEIFLTCEEEGVKVRVLVNFFPHTVSEISLEKLQHLPLLTFSTTPEDEYRLFVKRLFDVAAAAISLLITAPLLAVVALAVKASSAGPVIYSQERCGLNGRRFRLYKFRSMYPDAESRRAEVAHLNEMDGPVFKSAHDPRITPVGRYLRKFSIDEWPQLFNILKGDMSFVGPRPPLPDEVAQYERWQRRRLRMKPGVTCLWALEGRNKLDFTSWMRLDLQYIDQWSLLLDMKILLRTIPHVLSGQGL